MKLLLFLILLFYTVDTVTAQIQFVNNSPDTVFSTIKIMSGGQTLVESLEYRHATAFIPAGLTLGDSITVVSVSQPAFKQSFVFLADASFSARVIVQGVSEPAKFAANPDAREIGLMIVTQNVKSQADSPTETDVAITFGSTDAPICSLIAVDVAPLLKNGSFGDITPFTLPMPSTTYYCNLVEESSMPVVRRIFEVNLGAIQGKSALLLLSGFWNPEANSNGMPITLLLVYPDGKVEECSTVITGISESTHGNRHYAMPVYKATSELIVWESAESIRMAEIYSGDGSVVARMESGDSISTADMPNGGYLIRSVFNDGSSVSSKVMICR